MRRFVAALSLIAMAQTSFAGAFVCEKYINKYGLLSDRNCVYHSELNPNIVTPHKGPYHPLTMTGEGVFPSRKATPAVKRSERPPVLSLQIGRASCRERV